MAGIDGRVALITGAASGIGRATAIRLANDGAAVVIADIADVGATEAAEEITRGGGSALALHLDVANPQDWAWAVERTLSTYSRLDILVNNAGYGSGKPIEDLSYEEYRRVAAVTQDSVFLGMQAAAAALKASGNGSVVNISSIMGLTGGSGLSPDYHAAKGAIRVISKNTAVAWARAGVRVNSVHPGFIRTPLADGLPLGPYIEATPMGRMGEVAEVAALVAFLAGDDASFITGAEMVVDGGFTAV